MIAEIKHYLQDANVILAIMVWFMFPLIPLLLISVMMGINLTILIIYCFLFFIEIFIIILLDISFSTMGKYYINKMISMYKNEENSGEYSAVLIGNNLSCYKNIFTNGGACGLYFLNRYFENTNKRCKIRQNVDKTDFDEYVFDVNCQELYIIGHGSKKSFRMKNDTDNVDYSEYKGKIKHKKRIIAQLHCADSKIGDESLADILATDIDNSYVGCSYIFRIQIWYYCFKMWKNNRPKKIKR